MDKKTILVFQIIGALILSGIFYSCSRNNEKLPFSNDKKTIHHNESKSDTINSNLDKNTEKITAPLCCEINCSKSSCSSSASYCHCHCSLFGHALCNPPDEDGSISVSFSQDQIKSNKAIIRYLEDNSSLSNSSLIIDEVEKLIELAENKDFEIADSDGLNEYKNIMNNIETYAGSYNDSTINNIQDL